MRLCMRILSTHLPIYLSIYLPTFLSTYALIRFYFVIFSPFPLGKHFRQVFPNLITIGYLLRWLFLLP